jgi:integrase
MQRGSRQKQLTQVAVEQYKPDRSMRREIADLGKRGLYLVIQPTGVKSWAVRYRRQADGASRKYTLDGFPSLGTARKLAQTVLDKVAEGHDPAATKQIEKEIAREKTRDGDATFGAVARLFITRYARPKNRSWFEVARLLGLKADPEDDKLLKAIPGALVDRWGRRRIEEITKHDIVRLLDEIEDRGGGVTANRTLAALRKLWNWQMSRDDSITKSPCAGLVPPVPETKRDRVLTDPEVVAIWKAAGKMGWPFGNIVQLLLLTGQRRGEVRGMRWSELKLDEKLWVLPQGRVKNKNGHEVPLSAAAIRIIESVPRMKGCDLLFSTTGETAVSGFSKAKDELDALAGVADWRVHDLRRTAASGMARIGIQLPTVEKILNHSSGSFAGVAGIYQRYQFADEKARALDAWADFVETLVEGKPANVVALRA